MGKKSDRRVILTHWNAGVFHRASTKHLLPELIVYSLIYDEVLIREEDLLTNRAITRLLSDPHNFAVFADLLSSGLVKLLRLPLEVYPPGRQFDPLTAPISARVEEHRLRRTYKGKPWNPTLAEWSLFRALDEIVRSNPASSRYHTKFPADNPFAEQLADILDNRESYRLGSHPAFRRLHARTADTFAALCRDPEAWRRFLWDHGVKEPIVGPDAGFYRSAAYQCATFLPASRAIMRLVESVYAATYCDRELSDGRYGASDLVELPYRYPSDGERIAAAEDAVFVEISPTGASANVVLLPGIATAVLRTRESPEFKNLRSTLACFEDDDQSPLLNEAAFRDAWRGLCGVYSENAASLFARPTQLERRIIHYSVYTYLFVRTVGFIAVPMFGHLEPGVALDHLAAGAIHKFGPMMLSGLRAALKAPILQAQMESSVAVRCSNVPLTIPTHKASPSP